MFLIVGLGNPGWRYRKTRHNIGFMVLDDFSRRERTRFRAERGPFRSATVSVDDLPLLLVKPTTYMNASGRALRWLVDVHAFPLDRILVLVDDVNLPLGRLRLRRGGSDGGHRGLASVIESLGGNGFPRLRFGVGRQDGVDVVRHVLSRFTREERPAVREMIEAGGRAIREFARSGIDSAMSRINQNPSMDGRIGS